MGALAGAIIHLTSDVPGTASSSIARGNTRMSILWTGAHAVSRWPPGRQNGSSIFMSERASRSWAGCDHRRYRRSVGGAGACRRLDHHGTQAGARASHDRPYAVWARSSDRAAQGLVLYVYPLAIGLACWGAWSLATLPMLRSALCLAITVATIGWLMPPALTRENPT